MTYHIEDIFENGQFTKTQVTFTLISVGMLAALFGSGTVRSRMTEGAPAAMYVDFAASVLARHRAGRHMIRFIISPLRRQVRQSRSFRCGFAAAIISCFVRKFDES